MSERVLTTAWCDGRDFYDVVEHDSSERKNQIGLTLARFAHRSFFELGTLNADPHPGNYLFPESDAVVFLDFGCVREYDDDYINRERALARVVLDGRRSAFRDAVVATGMTPRPDRIDWDVHWDMLRQQLSPYLEPSFRFTKGWMLAAMKYSEPSNPNLRHLAIRPPWIWQQRLVWGLHAVLTRLSAEGDFRAVFRTAMDRPRKPFRERSPRTAP